jgi:hypothetical protein
MFGRLWVPEELLDETYARGLLRDYFRRDDGGWVYSGAMFDTYPAEPATAAASQPAAANAITDSDIVALSMLGIRATGYEALIITRYTTREIEALLAKIRADALIDEDESAGLLSPDGPAWKLWELLRDVKDRTKDARFGTVAAGKILARKRPGLVPIGDSRIAAVFRRPPPDRDERWWDDVRSASLYPRKTAAGTTLWRYLDRIKDEENLAHLPTLRVLDIIGWMHARQRVSAIRNLPPLARPPNEARSAVQRGWPGLACCPSTTCVTFVLQCSLRRSAVSVAVSQVSVNRAYVSGV